jgi:hypothetical protein
MKKPNYMVRSLSDSYRMQIEPYIFYTAEEARVLFHMMVERFDVSEHFQKHVVPIHQDLPMDVDPLILCEDRLLLGLLPFALLDEPSGPLPYIAVHHPLQRSGPRPV